MFELFKYNVAKFGVIKKRLSCVSCQNTFIVLGCFFKTQSISKEICDLCASVKDFCNLEIVN